MAAQLRSVSEKNTNWEGAYRVPAIIRWPGLVVLYLRPDHGWLL
jgi:arylsulfatase A-like enzyme